MADENDDFEDDIEQDGEDDTADEMVSMSKKNLQDMRRAAKSNSKARAEAAAAKKELAFVKAGVDLDSPTGKLLFKSWDSDSYEDVATQAQEIGALKEGFAVTDSSATSGDAKETEERQAMAQGSRPDEPTQLDPNEFIIDSAMDRMKKGAPKEDAMAEAFDDLLFTASQGDKRVIWSPGAES